MKTNTFYKPKNEYGELLASHEYVNIKIDDTNNRIDELEIKHNNKASFNIKIIEGDSIEKYFENIWKAPITQDKINELKIELGQTVYILQGRDDENTGLKTYEEYICLHPTLIGFDKQPEMIRLGAVDSIIARKNTFGSVQLIHDLHNDNVNWSEYYAKNWDGKIDTHTPAPGKAVAPCALRDFYEADINLSADISTVNDNLNETISRVEGLETLAAGNDAKIKRIIDELGGIIEDNKAEITDSRIDKNEELIDELRKVVGLGPHDCNSNSVSCNCGHECKFDTEEDCCLICKVNNLDEAVNTNADSLVELSDTLDNFKENTESSLESNTNSILNLETIIGTKRDTTREQSLSGYVAELDSLSQSLQSQITDNDIDISKIYSEIGDPSNNNPSNENSASLWANILQNREDIKDSSNAIKTINGNLETINNTIPDINTAIESIDAAIKLVNNSLGSNPHNAGEGKTAWSEIDKLFDEKADVSEVTAEIQSVTKQIEEAEDKVTNIINKEIGDKTSSDTDDTLWGSTKVNGEKIGHLELSLGNKEDGDSSDSAWANINKLQLGLDNLKTEVNEKITQTIEPFESRIEMLEDFNKVRNIVITTEIPAGEGEFLELKYSDILENIIPNGNWSNYEIIVNGVKIEDVDNITGEIYTISAWPSITYIKSKANDSNGAQFNKIRFDFADNDNIGHKTYISMTIYDVTQHENYIHL